MRHLLVPPIATRAHPLRLPLRTLLLIFLLCMSLAACANTTTTGNSTTPTPLAPVTLKVFAASSLTESFNAIATQYQAAHTNIKVVYNFNGSQILVQQMSNGASADVFASADEANMQKANAANLVLQSSIFARNKLTVIVPVTNPGHINTLKDLAQKGIKLVLAAPAVPAGKYSLQVLDNMGASSDYGPDYVKNVKGNVVSQEDNVKAVLQKVQLGEADAGIVYTTDVTAAAATKVNFIDIPDNFNVIARYPIAVTRNSTAQGEAQTFVQYILASSGQAVLSKYHFMSPGP